MLERLCLRCAQKGTDRTGAPIAESRTALQVRTA